MIEPSVAVLGGIAIVVLLGLSAFFSSSETAVFSLPADWADEAAADGDRRALTLQALQEDPHRLLVTILVGNNVVNIALSSIVTVLVTSLLPPSLAIVVTTAVTSGLVLIFGEIVPKAYGLGNNERWALTVARPVQVAERILSPVITLFDGITRQMNAAISADGDVEMQYAAGPLTRS